jgi:hypothetical protein
MVDVKDPIAGGRIFKVNVKCSSVNKNIIFVVEWVQFKDLEKYF